jgi:hypothetical protein
MFLSPLSGCSDLLRLSHFPKSHPNSDKNEAHSEVGYLEDRGLGHCILEVR